MNIMCKYRYLNLQLLSSIYLKFSDIDFDKLDAYFWGDHSIVCLVNLNLNEALVCNLASNVQYDFIAMKFRINVKIY